MYYPEIKCDWTDEKHRESMKYVKIPYWLVIKYYWKRLLAVSAIWFLYDFSTYSFGIFSSTILTNVMPADAPLSQSFGWNTVSNTCFIPRLRVWRFSYFISFPPLFSYRPGILRGKSLTDR
jgi:hypothetical protein